MGCKHFAYLKIKKEAHFMLINEKEGAYYVFWAYRRNKDGLILYARDYGFKAWRIPIYR